MAKIVMTEEASAPGSPGAGIITIFTQAHATDANMVLRTINPGGGVRIASNIPDDTQTHDLGSSSLAWRNLFLGGTAGVAKIVPGATSISLRNNADNADNLIVTDAGAVTIRAGLTVTAGGATVTAGGLTVTAGGLTVTAGAVTHSGTTEMTGNVTVNTNKVTIAAASGNTAIAGTLGVTGTTTLGALVAASATITPGGINVYGDSVVNGGLTITSTSAALIVPRMSAGQVLALTPAVGMIVYNTSDGQFQGYGGTGWVALA